jgi:hypothetical protein
MAVSPKETVALQLGPFTGLDATSDPSQVDGQHAVDCLNFVPDRQFKALVTMLGRKQFFVAPVLPAAILSDMVQFYDNLGNQWYYVVLGNGKIYKFQQSVSDAAQIATISARFGVFCFEEQWVFFSNGVDTPIKIDNEANVTDWQIAAPTVAPALTAGIGGDLTQNGQYAYCVTFGNSVVESSPCPITTFLQLTTTPSNGAVAITGAIVATSVYSVSIVGPNGTQTFSYAAVTSDTVGSIADNLASQINDATSIVATGGGTGSIGLSDPSASNAYSYYGSVKNAAGGSGAISPSTPTVMTGGIIQSSIELSSIPISADPQTTERNIYRIGGSQAEFQLVGTIGDNTTTTYTDNLSDGAITGQNLTEHRDPPAKFFSVLSYQDRTWGLGYSDPGNSQGANNDPITRSHVWYSAYLQPWAFDNTDQVIQVGVNIRGDYIVGGAPLPALLFVVKNKTCWAIIGSSPADYLPTFLFEIGGVSQKSIKSAYGVVIWLSPEGIIYMYDGGSYQDISTMTAASCSVKGLLDGMSMTDYEACSIGFWKGNCLVSFPTQGYTLMYNIASQTWWKLGYTFNFNYFDTQQELLVADVPTQVGNVAQWFAENYDFTGPISAYWKSGVVPDPTQNGQSQARHFILNSYGNSYGTAELTINCWNDLNNNPASFSRLVTLAADRQAISLPPGLTGSAFQIELAIPAALQETIISNGQLYTLPKRYMYS